MLHPKFCQIHADSKSFNGSLKCWTTFLITCVDVYFIYDYVALNRSPSYLKLLEVCACNVDETQIKPSWLR